MIGSHLSIAGGLHEALLRAESLKMQTVQVFTKNQRQWSARPLSHETITLWLTELHRLGWTKTVSHASYLINLASVDSEIRPKSIAAMIDEVQRCEVLEIPYLVVHPGSHKGRGEEDGIKSIVTALDEVLDSTEGLKTLICLETTAGGGNLLGGRFEHLAEIILQVNQPDRLATCFDTCHVAAAGYDMSETKKAASVFREFDRVVGLKTLMCFHLNDSKMPIGSHKDRHAHIGDGFVGLDAFRYILSQSRFKSIPKIMETPKEMTPKGTPWDTVNLRRLKRLM